MPNRRSFLTTLSALLTAPLVAAGVLRTEKGGTVRGYLYITHGTHDRWRVPVDLSDGSTAGPWERIP